MPEAPATSVAAAATAPVSVSSAPQAPAKPVVSAKPEAPASAAMSAAEPAATEKPAEPAAAPPVLDDAERATLRRLAQASASERKAKARIAELEAEVASANKLKDRAARADALEAAMKSAPEFVKLAQAAGHKFEDIVSAYNGDDEENPDVASLRKDLEDFKAATAKKEQEAEEIKTKSIQEREAAELAAQEQKTYNAVDGLIDANKDKYPIIAEKSIFGQPLREIAIKKAIDDAEAFIAEQSKKAGKEITVTGEQAADLINQALTQIEASLAAEYGVAAKISEPGKVAAPVATTGSRLGIAKEPDATIDSSVRGSLPQVQVKPPMSGGPRRLGEASSVLS